jgi:hypothetical protein
MKLTRDELISIVSDVTTLLGQILAQHVELQESLVGGGAGVERQKMKLNALKAKLAGEKLKLDKLNDAAKRKKELEKANKRSADRTTANEGKQSRVALSNSKGALIGWLSYEAGGKVTVYDSRGRLVARELAGITLDRMGRFVGRGRQGLVVLGRTQN